MYFIYLLFCCGCHDSSSAHLSSLYLTASVPADHFSPLSLSSFFLFLSPHFSLRLLVRTCVHHRHILATCYLITRARVTLKTSLAEQTRVKHQSGCYATKANHTTRLSGMVVRGTDTESGWSHFFSWKRRKTRKSDTTKNYHPRPSGE